MTTHKEYKEALRVVHAYDNAKQDKDDIIHHKRLKSLIGTCYRYRNSYGNDDSWWLYIEVVDVGEIGSRSVKIESFQETSLEVEIKRHHHSLYNHDGMDSDGYERISREEFEAGKQAVLDKLNLKPFTIKGDVKIK